MRPVSLKLRISLLVTAVLVAVIATISSVTYVELRESIGGSRPARCKR